MNKKELEKMHDNLIFVGYTNGHQIKYGLEGEGAFYSTYENQCYIPLYMLKSHWHRLESTSNGEVTIQEIRKLQRDLEQSNDNN